MEMIEMHYGDYQKIEEIVQSKNTSFLELYHIHNIFKELDSNNDYEEISCIYDKEEIFEELTCSDNDYGLDNYKKVNYAMIEEELVEKGLVKIY